MSKGKVVIAAGGTGGHMFPAQALARQLQKNGIEILFVGARLDVNKYFHRTLFPFETIASSSFVLKGPLKYLLPLTSLCRGAYQSLRVLRRFHPDLIVGFGSYHTAPVLMAASLLKKPFFLFESNAWPGKVNRFFSRFARLNIVQFAKAQQHLKGKSCQAPVPFWLKDDMILPSKEEALAYYGLENARPTMLVFGGSQGARAINGAAQDVMKLVSDSGVNLQIIHILGDESLIKEYEEAYQAMNVCCSVKGFEDKMAYGWVAADFVLCRAGAASIAELLRFEVPAILVPFPKAAEDHQLLNAQELMNLGLGVCIEERELNFHTLFKAVSKMLDVSLYRQMKEGMKALKEKGKAENLCQLVESFIQKQRRGIYE